MTKCDHTKCDKAATEWTFSASGKWFYCRTHAGMSRAMDRYDGIIRAYHILSH